MSSRNDQPFVSVLAPLLRDLIAEKRGAGYHYVKESKDYGRFDQFCATRDHRVLALPRELVDAWTAKQSHETESNRQRRLSLLRVLGQYMQRCGYSAWVYPPRALSASTSRYVPYIFSTAEVAALWRVVDACPAEVNAPYRDRVLPVLFRVLYGTGLRVSEALALHTTDVDRQSGTLHIREAKLDKERRIPMHPTLAERVDHYLTTMALLVPSEGPLFPCQTGESYAANTIYTYFRRFLWQAGISHQGRGHGPRLHDLSYPHLNKIPTLVGEHGDGRL